MPSEYVDARVVPAAGLHVHLPLKDIAESVRVRTTDKNHPVFLIQKTFLYVLKHGGFTKRYYQIGILTREHSKLLDKLNSRIHRNFIQPKCQKIYQSNPVNPIEVRNAAFHRFHFRERGAHECRRFFKFFNMMFPFHSMVIAKRLGTAVAAAIDVHH